MDQYFQQLSSSDFPLKFVSSDKSELVIAAEEKVSLGQIQVGTYFWNLSSLFSEPPYVMMCTKLVSKIKGLISRLTFNFSLKLPRK